MPARSHRAFTLVEITIVVAILAILAALVLPRVTTGAETARQTALKENLRYLRTQITVYQATHHGIAPGYPDGNSAAAPTPQSIIDQLTLYTTDAGSTSATAHDAYRLGPYLVRIPVNPVNQSADITIIPNGATFPAVPDGKTGWIYQPSTGSLAPNVPGKDPDGTDYFDY